MKGFSTVQLELFSENFLFPWVAQLGEEMCLLLLPS